jgi:hypothetical protein
MMRRLCGIVLGVCLIAAAPALTTAAQEPKAKETEKKADTAKTMTVSGVVSDVTADSLTVKVKSEEMKFTVDKETDVKATGASRKTAEMKKEGKPTMITDFVKTGDQVTVQYHDMGTTKHAASVRVRGAK